MADCEWMFGDAASGLLGIQATASLNPLRWSSHMTFDQCRADLRKIQAEGDRPIILKAPPGVMSPEHLFNTTLDAISWLDRRDPVKIAEAARAALALSERRLADQEAESRRADEAAEAAEASLRAREEELAHAQSELTAQYMYGDIGSASLGIEKLAPLNPLRWSRASSINECIAKLEAELQKRDRPVKLRVPAAFATEPELFGGIPAAIEHLIDACPGKRAARENVATAREAEAQRRAEGADARERLEAARAAVSDAVERLEEATRALAEGGAEVSAAQQAAAATAA